MRAVKTYYRKRLGASSSNLGPKTTPRRPSGGCRGEASSDCLLERKNDFHRRQKPVVRRLDRLPARRRATDADENPAMYRTHGQMNRISRLVAQSFGYRTDHVFRTDARVLPHPVDHIRPCRRVLWTEAKSPYLNTSKRDRFSVHHARLPGHMRVPYSVPCRTCLHAFLGFTDVAESRHSFLPRVLEHAAGCRILRPVILLFRNIANRSMLENVSPLSQVAPSVHERRMGTAVKLCNAFAQKQT